LSLRMRKRRSRQRATESSLGHQCNIIKHPTKVGCFFTHCNIDIIFLYVNICVWNISPTIFSTFIEDDSIIIYDNSCAILVFEEWCSVSTCSSSGS